MKIRKATINQIEINHLSYIPQKGIYLKRNLDIPIHVKKSRANTSIWNNINASKGLFGFLIVGVFVAELSEAVFDISSLWIYGFLILLIIIRQFLKHLFLSGLINITKKEIQVCSKSIWGLQQVKSFSFDASKAFDLKVISQSEGFLITFLLQNENIECYLTDYKHLTTLIEALSDLLGLSIENTFQNKNSEEIIRFR